MALLLEIRRDVDLQPMIDAPAIYHVSQDDVGTHLILGLKNGGKDYVIPGGTQIIVRGSRHDGAFFAPVAAEITGTSTATFTLTTEMSGVPGKTICEAVLTNSGNVVGTANFVIDVEESPTSNTPIPQTDATWNWIVGQMSSNDISALDDKTLIEAINGKVDGQETNETLNALVSSDATLSDELYEYESKAAAQTSAGYMLTGESGLSEANQWYKLVVYSVTPGEKIRIISDHRYQFQDTNAVVTSGTNSHLIGVTYGKISGVVVVPAGANYIVMSTPVSNGIAAVYASDFRYRGAEYDLRMSTVPFASFDTPGQTSVEGICVIDNDFLVLARYAANNTRSISVWDMRLTGDETANPKVSETFFTEAQVGHMNCLAYHDGSIYITTLGKVVKVNVDPTTKALTYVDQAVSDQYIHALDYYNGKFYCFKKGTSAFELYETTENTATGTFETMNLVGTSTFGNFALDTCQGFCIHDGKCFIPISTAISTYSGTASDRFLYNEMIVVTDLNLNVLKVQKISRGEHGEIEDCAVSTFEGQHYLLISFNHNNFNVGSVHAAPIYTYTTIVDRFYQTITEGRLNIGASQAVIYVDSSAVSPFANGSPKHPLGSLNVAMTRAHQLNLPVRLNIKGTFTDRLRVSFFKNPLYLEFDGATITGLNIRFSNNVYINWAEEGTSSDGVTMSYLAIEGSTVYIKQKVNMVNTTSAERAVQVERGILTGVVTNIGSYDVGIFCANSIVALFTGTNSATKSVQANTNGGIVNVNKVFYWHEE